MKGGKQSKPTPAKIPSTPDGWAGTSAGCRRGSREAPGCPPICAHNCGKDDAGAGGDDDDDDDGHASQAPSSAPAAMS
jgi:hypothetical protein